MSQDDAINGRGHLTIIMIILTTIVNETQLWSPLNYGRQTIQIIQVILSSSMRQACVVATGAGRTSIMLSGSLPGAQCLVNTRYVCVRAVLLRLTVERREDNTKGGQCKETKHAGGET